jgi:lipoate-protein ligase A
MNIEEMQKQLKVLKEQQQDKFIDHLEEMVTNLHEKALMKDYEPTNHEREIFEYIRQTLNDMAKWF